MLWLYRWWEDGVEVGGEGLVGLGLGHGIEVLLEGSIYIFYKFSLVCMIDY